MGTPVVVVQALQPMANVFSIVPLSIGGVAQLVERQREQLEVIGSSPVSPTSPRTTRAHGM